MTTRLPQRMTPPATKEQQPRGRIVYEYSASSRVGGLAGFLIGGLVLAALVGFLLLGAVALTVALWIALGAAVIGVIAALIRGVFGGGGRIPPR